MASSFSLRLILWRVFICHRPLLSCCTFRTLIFRQRLASFGETKGGGESEILKTNLETNPKPQSRNESRGCGFATSCFEFVSYFVFRIWDLPKASVSSFRASK